MSGSINFLAAADTVTVSYDLQTTFFPDFEVIVKVDGRRCGLGIHGTPFTHPVWGLYPHPILAFNPVVGSFDCKAKTRCECKGTSKGD
jgi:hypothetical protein